MIKTNKYLKKRQIKNKRMNKNCNLIRNKKKIEIDYIFLYVFFIKIDYKIKKKTKI